MKGVQRLFDFRRVSALTTKQSTYGWHSDGKCWGEETTPIKWTVGVEVETPIGKGTGDGLRHSAECCKAGYQFQGLPRVNTYRSPDEP